MFDKMRITFIKFVFNYIFKKNKFYSLQLLNNKNDNKNKSNE